MTLLTRLFRRRAAFPEPACCGRCRAFDNDPRAIEAAMPGLASLGSARASVSDADGLCHRRDRYSRATSCCSDFEAIGSG